MNYRPLNKSVRVAGLSTLLLLLPTLGFVQGCTDLTEIPTSSIAPENFYRNEEEVLGGLASVYAQLRQTIEASYNASEVSSDEYIVPTRATDWYDGGRWLFFDRQTWEANNSASNNDGLNGAWNALFVGVARANVAMAAVNQVEFPSKPVVLAELRTLRAFYYFLLQDLFGGVQIVEDTEIKPRERNTRAEVFAFIESELNATRAVLPASWVPEMNGRMTRGAADAILASLYINAQVFTGEVTLAGLTAGPAKWQEAADAADRVINSGIYLLESDFHRNFAPDNHLSREIIMSIKFLNATDLGLNFLMRALHYSQYTPQPWNGFATIAETYLAFDPEDRRRDIFLEGQQFNLDTGEPVVDNQGNPLVFTLDILPRSGTGLGADNTWDYSGVRIAKWPPDPNRASFNSSNDFAHFRLAEMYLIKAEALNEMGRTLEAIALVNEVRLRAFATPEPISTALTQAQFRTVILNERLFELTAEGKRRQDQIRHGTFLLPWFNKEQREPYRILMPIPQIQIEANALLAQNPGY
jgi:hypothetical protein